MSGGWVGLGALGWYCAMSAVAFGMFWWDKRAAGRGGWRTPEKTLHLVELLGGWPGAMLGQRLLRHKSKKVSYRITLWAIAAVHVAGWAWWLVGAR